MCPHIWMQVTVSRIASLETWYLLVCCHARVCGGWDFFCTSSCNMLSFLRWKRWLLKRPLQKKSSGSHVRSSWLPHLVSSRGLRQRCHRFHQILHDVQHGALTTIAAHSQFHLLSSTHCGTADGTLRRAGRRCPSPRTRKTGCRTMRSRCPSTRSRIEHLGLG